MEQDAGDSNTIRMPNKIIDDPQVTEHLWREKMASGSYPFIEMMRCYFGNRLKCRDWEMVARGTAQNKENKF